MRASIPRAPRRHVTVDQYLALERDSAVRHEYLAGEVFAMSGTSARHDGIVSRLLTGVAGFLVGSCWQAQSATVRVRIHTHMREYFYYPDLIVHSETDTDVDSLFVGTPKLIAEVISPSTENIDRREKALMYREIPTLEEYVLVAQESYEVTLYRRHEEWRPIVHKSLDAVAEFQSLGASMRLADIYRSPGTGADAKGCR